MYIEFLRSKSGILYQIESNITFWYWSNEKINTVSMKCIRHTENLLTILQHKMTITKLR